MTAATRLPSITVQEYLAHEAGSEVKHEYRGGRVYAMAGGSRTHARIGGNVYAAMHARLRGQPCEPFNSDMKLRVQYASETRLYYPDHMVVCEGDTGEEYFVDAPRVIVEVLSPRTRRVDEGEKREAYLSIPSLRAYLLVEVQHAAVVVYRRGEAGFAEELHQGLDAVIALPEIGTDLPLRELYERVDFEAASAEVAHEEAVLRGEA
jgi:Uma2 family endonuclease